MNDTYCRCREHRGPTNLHVHNGQWPRWQGHSKTSTWLNQPEPQKIERRTIFKDHVPPGTPLVGPTLVPKFVAHIEAALMRECGLPLAGSRGRMQNRCVAPLAPSSARQAPVTMHGDMSPMYL